MEHLMMSSNQHSSLRYSTDYNISYILLLYCSMYMTSFSNKQSGTQFYDRKPMQSIILHKNFQEDH